MGFRRWADKVILKIIEFQKKFNLEGKTALITGAAGLLGKQHAFALLELNAHVILTDIDFDQLRVLKKELSKDTSKLILLLFSFFPIIFWELFCYSKGLGYEFLHTNIIINLLARSEDSNNYKLISYFLLLNEKFLITFTFFLLSCWIKWNKEIFSFVSIVSITYILILFFIYLTTPYELYFQLNSTAARVIKSLSFFLAFFGLYNLRNYKLNL